MTVLEYLEKTYDAEKTWMVRKPIICKDGFTVSVQGGTRSHYCTPRESCNFYYDVELGFTSEEIPELAEYAENKEKLKDTVYGYVPIDKVEDLIMKHGGIATGG